MAKKSEKSNKKKSKEKEETKKVIKSEMKKSISIQLDINLVQQLDKRARKNFMTLRELIDDILRRSMTTYNKGKRPRYAEPDVGKLVRIFSRKKRGRKAKK